MLERKYSSWKEFYQVRQKYCTLHHYPFFEIAGKYLPKNENAIIVDIGAGYGGFADHLKLLNKYENIFLLDKNPRTVETLKSRYKNAILYTAPEKLPFEDATVDFIHCSHLLEHLNPSEFYKLLKEIDRVLKINGILVISTPLLYDGFYGDISHIKPYNPWVIYKYLCTPPWEPSQEDISEKYVKLELEFRYTAYEFDEYLGSEYKPIDVVIYLFKRILSKLKIRKYKKSAYTMVLKKT